MPSADVKKLEKALPDLLETDPEFLERSEPQSPQSVFRLHCENSEPGPPSSPAFEGTRAVMHALNPGLQHKQVRSSQLVQSPSLAKLQIFVQPEMDPGGGGDGLGGGGLLCPLTTARPRRNTTVARK